MDNANHCSKMYKGCFLKPKEGLTMGETEAPAPSVCCMSCSVPPVKHVCASLRGACARPAVSGRVLSAVWKRSRNQLQLFSVDNVIKLGAAANTLGSASYLERTEIYKRRDRSVHSKRGAPRGPVPSRRPQRRLKQDIK